MSILRLFWLGFIISLRANCCVKLFVGSLGFNPKIIPSVRVFTNPNSYIWFFSLPPKGWLIFNWIWLIPLQSLSSFCRTLLFLHVYIYCFSISNQKLPQTLSFTPNLYDTSTFGYDHWLSTLSRTKVSWTWITLVFYGYLFNYILSDSCQI